MSSKIIGLRNFLELTRVPHSTLTAKFVAEVEQPVATSPTNLLDDSIADNDKTPERNLVNKILSMVERLRLISKDSKHCLEELSRKLQSDDISSILVLNHGREEEIYKGELAKFSQFESQLEAMSAASQKILAELGQDINHLQQVSKTWTNLEKIDRNSKGLASQWENDLVSYMEMKSTLEGYYEAVKDVSVSLTSARNAAINFANRRLVERQNLVGRIDSNQAEASQRALQAQLDRLQVGSASSSLTAPTFRPAVSPVAQSSLPPPNYSLPQPGLFRSAEYANPQPLYGGPQNLNGARASPLSSPNATSYPQQSSYLPVPNTYSPPPVQTNYSSQYSPQPTSSLNNNPYPTNQYASQQQNMP
jgi:ALIX V-shaped domain binding to HIV